VCGPLLFQAAPSATPLVIDISVVELSELETSLPPAVVGRSDEPKARARIPDPVDLKPKSAPQRPKETVQNIPSAVTKKISASPEATAAVAPPVGESTVGGGGEAVEKARVSYRDFVATKLARAKRYPERAVRNEITGRGVLRLTINATGTVVSAKVAESTQSEVLDDELLRMVDRAAPFPAFPESMNQTDLSLLIPVSFRLDR
jgi:protein TonB